MDQPQNNMPMGGGSDSNVPQPHHNTLMGVLAYLGILVIIPYFAAKDDAFVKFHVKQGLVLFVVEIALWILGAAASALWVLLSLINLGVIILAIVGIVNVVNGKEEPLPLVGNFAKHFTF